MIIREQVIDLALKTSDSIIDHCNALEMILPNRFEDEFYEELEELFAKYYGDPDYGNHN